jgi:hypothetical protein
MGAWIDLTGQKFGGWTVLRDSGERDASGSTRWHCRCDCGVERVVSSQYLKIGRSKSCGCTKGDSISRSRKTHGLTHHPLYPKWAGIMRRCYGTGITAKYRGRITVCERWHDVRNFIADVEHLALPGLSIDRIDNEGPYSPENTRWVDGFTQANNTRKNVFLTHNGKTQTIAQWARELGMLNSSLWGRINDYGWSVEKALTTPVKR